MPYDPDDIVCCDDCFSNIMCGDEFNYCDINLCQKCHEKRLEDIEEVSNAIALTHEAVVNLSHKVQEKKILNNAKHCASLIDCTIIIRNIMQEITSNETN